MNINNLDIQMILNLYKQTNIFITSLYILRHQYALHVYHKFISYKNGLDLLMHINLHILDIENH